jgi:hypothetical protein
MIGFLRGRFEHACTLTFVVSDRSLAEVERLRADLADVIDAHESGGVSAFAIVERRFDDIRGGRGPHRDGLGLEDRA